MSAISDEYRKHSLVVGPYFNIVCACNYKGTTVSESGDYETHVAEALEAVSAAQLDAALTTLAEVREWRLWAHEQYGLPLSGTVTSNRLKVILGIIDEEPDASPEMTAYRKRIMELYNDEPPKGLL